MRVMLFADDQVVSGSAIQPVFGMTKEDRVDGAEVCVPKGEGIVKLPPSCR